MKLYKQKVRDLVLVITLPMLLLNSFAYSLYLFLLSTLIIKNTKQEAISSKLVEILTKVLSVFALVILVYSLNHVYCFIQCLRDPENPFNPGGGYLLDFEVPWKN